jgi:hypothetical protein
MTRGDELVTVELLGDGTVRARLGVTRHLDGELAGTPKIVLELLLGKIGLQQERANGIEYKGDPKVLRRVTARNTTAWPGTSGTNS